MKREDKGIREDIKIGRKDARDSPTVIRTV